MKTKSKFFIPWVIAFLIILITIPILLKIDAVQFAKILGFLFVVFGVVAITSWWKLSKNKDRSQRAHLTMEDKRWMQEHLSFYRLLTTEDKIIFEDRIGLFIANVKRRELEPEEEDKTPIIYVASSAIIAFWGTPYYSYKTIKEVEISKETDVHHGKLNNGIFTLSLPKIINVFKLNNKFTQNIPFKSLFEDEEALTDGLSTKWDDFQRLWSPILLDDNQLNNEKKGVSYNEITDRVFYMELKKLANRSPDLFKKKNTPLFEAITQF